MQRCSAAAHGAACGPCSPKMCLVAATLVPLRGAMRCATLLTVHASRGRESSCPSWWYAYYAAHVMQGPALCYIPFGDRFQVLAGSHGGSGSSFRRLSALHANASESRVGSPRQTEAALERKEASMVQSAKRNFAREDQITSGRGQSLGQRTVTEGMTQMRLIEMWMRRRDPDRKCLDLQNISFLSHRQSTKPALKTCTVYLH